MKKNRYITLTLLIAIALFAVSCSADFGKNVYYGGISGVVLLTVSGRRMEEYSLMRSASINQQLMQMVSGLYRK